MDKQKELIEVKKLYLIQTETFENKIYYSLLVFATSLIFFSLKKDIPNYYVFIGFMLFLFITLLFIYLQRNRKSRFNKLELFIKSGGKNE